MKMLNSHCCYGYYSAMNSFWRPKKKTYLQWSSLVLNAPWKPIQHAKQKDESTVWPGFPVLHNAHFLSFAASVCLPAWLCLPVTHQHLGGDLHTQRGRKSRFECASAMEGASVVLKGRQRQEITRLSVWNQPFSLRGIMHDNPSGVQRCLFMCEWGKPACVQFTLPPGLNSYVRIAHALCGATCSCLRAAQVKF